jgi:NTE family protein
MFEGSFKFYFGSSNFRDDFNELSVVKTQISKAFKIDDKLALNINTEGGFKIGNNDTKALLFGLGGMALIILITTLRFMGIIIFR